MARWTSAGTRLERVDLGALPEPDFDWSWTEDGPAWVAPAIDTRRPSIARIYDHALGGKDNYAVDRDAADRLCQIVPDAGTMARANRAFVLRAVTSMAEAGISQFLDLGAGMPNAPTVHDVARSTVPDARVVYVDQDPIVMAHTRALLDGNAGLCGVLHDLREPARVLHDPHVRSIIRFDEPVGLILGAVLQFVDQSIGAQVVRHYVDKIAEGSQVAFSMGTVDGVPSTVAHGLQRLFHEMSLPIALRTLAQTEEVVDGLDLLPPGITDVTGWRCSGQPGVMRMHAGLAVKRASAARPLRDRAEVEPTPRRSPALG